MTNKQTHLIPTRILFTHYGDNWIRGSERCLLDLLQHIDRSEFTPIVWCNSQKMYDEVSNLNIEVIKSDFPILFGWMKPKFPIKGFFNLVKHGINIVDKYNIKLIHANSAAPNQFLNLVARARKIPLLTHLHSRYPLRDRVTLGLQQVSMVVGVSKPVIKQLLDDGFSKESTCIIENGIDSRALEKERIINIKKTLNLKDDEFLVTTVGSLIYRKGMDKIVEAIHLLNQRGLKISLAIIGDGPERHYLKKQIEQSGVSHKIFLMGEQDNVVGILRGGTDLFVSAAREEVFGLVLAEAGLSGLAVVAPDVGGIPNVVINGTTGILFDSNDIFSLVQSIEELYFNKQQRLSMGRAGRRHILQNFTIQRNVLEFEKLYTQLLNDPSMKLCWYSRWNFRKPIKVITKKVFELIRYRYLSGTTQ